MLCAAYSDPGRHYHNLVHIEDCLNQLERFRDLTSETAIIEMAIWFHDAVYDSTSKGNEEASAELAGKMLAGAGLDMSVVRKIRELILVTKHQQLPTSLEERILVDVDLSILGRTVEEFARYDCQIREEYAWVPEADYRQGRMVVLQSFLDRPSIYNTDLVKQLWEEAARRNLQAAIESLRDGNLTMKRNRI